MKRKINCPNSRDGGLRLNLGERLVRRQQANSHSKVKLESRRRSLNSSVMETESQRPKHEGQATRNFKSNSVARPLIVRPNSSQVYHHQYFPSERSSAQKQQYTAQKASRSPQDRPRCYTQPPQFDTDETPYCRLEGQKDIAQIKVINANFSHHNSQTCVCNLCDCGRHLCKLHVVKPDLHSNTIYKSQFRGGKPIMNLPIKPTTETPPMDGPHLNLGTVYGTQFDKKSTKAQRPKPQNELTTGGPSSNLSTYASQFPGFKGVNQYVKPTNNTSLNGILQFGSGGTVYQKSYVPFGRRTADKVLQHCYFKRGALWLGKTTYNQDFGQKAGGEPSRSQKSQEKLKTDPDFRHQYETTYRNEFKLNGNIGCPAKLRLLRQGAKVTDLQLNDNADYKSINPHFSPISLTNFHLN